MKTNQNNFFSSLFNDLFCLFFPDLCVCCLNSTPSSNAPLCIHCLVDLPNTNFHKTKDNPFTERFFGRIPIDTGSAFLHFEKSGRVQKIIHALKYKDRPDLGLEFGKMYGEVLKKSSNYQDVNAIVAVPLHKKKLLKRGYNQSEKFGRGVAEGMSLPYLKSVILRKDYTSTQTKKSRIDRFRNVEKAFELSGAYDIEGLHLLLVDDVLTTGATLEACGRVLLKEKGVNLSLATLAIAEN